MLVYNNKGNVVGKITGDTLEKNVTGKKHMLRNPPAWGYDVDIIDKAIKAGVKFLRIYDNENGKVYTASLEEFRSHSFKQDRGYGMQRFLPLHRWAVGKTDKQLEMF